MFGVTEEGNSVAAYIHNFTAYFYAQVDRCCDFTIAELEMFKEFLCTKISAPSSIVAIEVCEKFTIMNY